MNKRPSPRAAEIILGILLAVSFLIYALDLINLFRNSILIWLHIGSVLVVIAWGTFFVLPNVLKEIKREKK